MESFEEQIVWSLWARERAIDSYIFFSSLRLTKENVFFSLMTSSNNKLLFNCFIHKWNKTPLLLSVLLFMLSYAQRLLHWGCCGRVSDDFSSSSSILKALGQTSHLKWCYHWSAVSRLVEVETSLQTLEFLCLNRLFFFFLHFNIDKSKFNFMPSTYTVDQFMSENLNRYVHWVQNIY